MPKAVFQASAILHEANIMEYLEPLPKNCPPKDAKDISDDITVYRLVKTAPPTADDFRSARAISPNRPIRNECIARGLSVWQDKDKCNQVGLLPNFKDRIICSVLLKTGAGKIKAAGLRGHYTWWPFRSYPILSCCKVELL